MTDPPRWVLPSFLASSLLCILISYLSFTLGFFIIVQNLYYIPIIIACIFYGWRGLFLSVFLAISYLFLFASFTSDPVLLQEAMIRVILFSLIAGVITALSLFREKTEQQLIESEHRLFDIIDFLPDATFAVDENGVVIAWNHAIEEMTGVPAEEMIGQGEYAYAVPFYGKRQPMLIDLAFKDDLELRSRYSLLKEMPDAIEAEKKYIRLKGEDRILWGRVSPLYNRNGKYAGAIETIRDITRRKEREETLERSEHLQKLILAAVPDIFIRCNSEGRYLDVLTPDDDRLVFPRDELIGKTVVEMTSEETGGMILTAIGLALDTGEMQTIEYDLSVPAGHRHFEARIAPYAADEVITLIRDITDQKEAEDALRERIRELSCLNRISVAIEHFDLRETEVFRKIIEIIPEGLQHPEKTHVRITIDDTPYSTPGFVVTNCSSVREIPIPKQAGGTITVCFDDEYELLPEELDMLRIIAEQIGLYIEGIRGVEILHQKNEELATAEEELRSQLDELVATQQQLRESEEYIRTVLDNLPIGVAVNSVDPEVNFEYFNENFLRIYRTTAEALSGRDSFWETVYEDPVLRNELKERVVADVLSGDPERMYWKDIPITRKGEKTTYICAHNIPIPGRDLMVSTVWDVTNRVEAENRLLLHVKRTEALLELHRMAGSTEQELMDYAITASLTMTNSRYAFIGLMNEDESVMTVHAWSGGLMEECSVVDSPIEYSIGTAGIWGECVRSRTHTLINDYAAPHPAKNGLPKGHIPISRYLGVPIKHGDRIVAVLAVANKGAEYQDDDVSALTTLGNQMGELIFRQRSEDALQESEQRYRTLSTVITDFAYSCLKEDEGIYQIDWMAGATRQITGYETDEVIAERCWGFMIHPDDWQIFEDSILTLPEGESSECDLRIITKEGNIRWLSAETRCISDESGRSRLYGGCRDITKEKTAQIELELNHARLESAMEAGGIAWWEMNCLTGEVIFSPRKAAMLGYSPERFSHYTDFTELLHPDDHEKAMQAMRDHLEGRKERYEVDYRIQASDGSYLWFNDIGTITERGEGGRPEKLVGLVVNTTAIKETDEALRESEKRFKTLFMESPVSIIIHDRDTGEIIDANRKACSSYGFSSFESMKAHDFWMESPYSFKEAQNFIRKAASEGPQEFEWLNRSVTGELFWEHVWLISVVISGVERILATSIDITGRKHAEEELRKSEALLSAAGRMAQFGGWSSNLKEQRVTWSDEVARIHGVEPGYSPSVDEGMAFYAPEWRKKISKVFSACVRDGIPYDEEMEIITADGERRWVRTVGEAVRDNFGEIIRVQGAFQDITERKLAEEERKKAYAQIEDNMLKFSVLNDEIRNPLAVIMALADIQGGEYTDKIIDQVKLIDRIITLLDQGMLESESIRAFMKRHDQLSG